MEASHSPFGFVWQIASQTGWSVSYILWRVPYPTLLMMIYDAPRYMKADEIRRLSRKGKTGTKVSGQNSLEYFQTKLNNEKK